MLATFLIEIALATFVFIRHRSTRFGKTAGLTLILLAVFQIAEYKICARSDDISILWAKVGFVAITLLPVLGLYLVSLVSRKPHFLWAGYLSAAAFAGYFLLVPKSISAAICGGNYVIFKASHDVYWLYGLYYWGFLLLGIWESLEKMSEVDGGRVRNVLKWMIVAYASFMAPMGAVYFLVPITRGAFASVMCGFAVTMAFLLALKIVPAYDLTHSRHS